MELSESGDGGVMIVAVKERLDGVMAPDVRRPAKSTCIPCLPRS